VFHGRPSNPALARQTVYGAGRMLAETREPAAELRRRVTSPGGTTEAALRVLIRGGLGGIFRKALTAARQRSRALSAGF
jgi:pyrroline-5-carboxylate reductase